MKQMEKRDARKVTPDAQYEIRRQAVKLHQANHSLREIAAMLDVDRNTVGAWIKRYNQGGIAALKIQKRGPKTSPTQLTEIQQKHIQNAIIDRQPEQYKLAFALWTREAVGLYIKEYTGHELDLRQVGRYLKRWGFTPQRPVKRAYQRCDKDVRKWLDEEYPKIAEMSKVQGSEIHWADQAGLKSHDHRGRGFAPKGQTPVRNHNPAYEKINMISSVTNRGKLRFMCYEGNFNHRVFHRFLKGLIEESNGKKIHVIVDNLRVHHAKKIKRWLRRYQEKIQLHHLPSYCPDLNPDEYFNCDIKTELAKRPERRQKGNWSNTVKSTLETLAQNPDRVRSYFKAKPIQYAA